MSKSYLLTYPDGSKKHIRRAERDDLLLSGLAKEVGPDRYAYTGEERTLHDFASLGTVNFHFGEPKKRYYPGAYIIELKDRRYHERLETPESLAFRITNAANLETETA